MSAAVHLLALPAFIPPPHHEGRILGVYYPGDSAAAGCGNWAGLPYVNLVGSVVGAGASMPVSFPVKLFSL